MPLPRSRRQRKSLVSPKPRLDKNTPFTFGPTVKKVPLAKRRLSSKREEETTLSWDDLPTRGNRRTKSEIPLQLRAATIALILVIGLLGLAFLAPKMREMISNKPRPKDPKLEHLKRDAVVDYFRNYYECQTWQERATMVRNPDRVKPLMKSYYSKHPLEQIDLNTLTSFGLLKNLDQEFGYAEFSRNDDPMPAKSVFSIENDGRFLMDWEATLPYSEASLAELTAAEFTEEVTLRVRLVRADYYNYGYSDSEKYASFAIRQKGGDEVGYAYMRRDHSHYQALQAFLVKKGDSPIHPIRINPTIRVVKRPDNQSNQMEIVDVLSHYWLVVDPVR